jgi:steroid delta-isomerase-like uncharacterized protein
MTGSINPERLQARLHLVDEHIRSQNQRDLDGILAAFGETPAFVLNGARHPGAEQIRELYQMMLGAFPDLRIDVRKRHLAGEAVIAEVVLRGTQEDTFLRVPATGRRIEVPMCAIFHFDADEKLADETVYFDGALLLRQLGMLPAAA